MAMRAFSSVRSRVRAMDIFELCLIVSILLHSIVSGAYFISNMPGIGGSDEKFYDASSVKLKNVDVDFIDIPQSVIMGGDTNPAPVQKEEWIEGSGKDRPDAENTDININKLSGDGTDSDGYMYADLSDHPPMPILDFDPNSYFPKAAKSANIRSYTVLLRMQINDDGSIKSAKIISLPSIYGFDEAAMKVVQRLRFRAGKMNGKPVKMFMQLPITFVLGD